MVEQYTLYRDNSKQLEQSLKSVGSHKYWSSSTSAYKHSYYEWHH